MISYLLDINVWLAMTWDLHPEHAPAARWYGSQRDTSFLFCRFTMLGFLRLLTDRQVMGGSTINLGAAFRIYDQWISDPRVTMTSELRSMELLFRQAAEPFDALPATKAIADCYLVALAQAVGARIVTFDKGLVGTARFRHVPATLLKSGAAN